VSGKLLVRAIAERRVGGVLAATEPDGAATGGLVLERREFRTFVGTVAERLFGGLAAGAPPIGLALLDVDGHRGAASDLRVCHGGLLEPSTTQKSLKRQKLQASSF